MSLTSPNVKEPYQMHYEEIEESEDICLAASQDKVCPPPWLVLAPVDNSATFWLHHPQDLTAHKPVQRTVRSSIVLLLMLHPSAVLSDEEMYCNLHILYIIFLQRYPLSGHFHLPKCNVLQTASGFIYVRLAFGIIGARSHSFESGHDFCQLLPFRLLVGGGQL